MTIRNKKLMVLAAVAACTLLLVPALLGSVLMPTQALAQADLLSGEATGAQPGIVGFGGGVPETDSGPSWFTFLLYQLVKFLAWILAFVAMFVNWVMSPFPVTTSTLVQIGWTVTRDFANMFFILILLGIALDFILFNSFQVKKMLPRLLLIALLINFSLPIAGIVIDFANVFTSFFLDKVSGGGFTEAIGQSVGIQRILDANSVQAATTPASALQSTVLEMFFVILYLIGMIFIFLALGLMFLIRTGYLSFLLILLPMVLVLYAFPPTSGKFGQWQNSFIKWTMFAPAAAFFLYLSILVLSATGSQSIITAVRGVKTATATDFFSTTLSTFVRYIIAWALMLGSLVTAQQMGIHTAGAARAVFTKVGKGVRGKAASGAWKSAAWATRKTGADKGVEKLGAVLSKIPGAGMLARGITGAAVKTKEFAKAAIPQKELDAYKQYSDEQLHDTYNRSSGARKAAAANILAQRGKLRIMGADGKPHPNKTKELVKEAYALNKIHGDKTALANVRRASPAAYKDIADEEWKRLEKENKIVTQKRKDRDGNDITVRVDSKTGETREEKENMAYDIRTSDLENMKGMWDGKLMEGFVKSGKLTSGFIRSASNANDYQFIDELNTYLEKVSADDLQKTNPGLLNALRSGNIDEFVIVPSHLQGSKKKKDLSEMTKEERFKHVEAELKK
ncbi:hypothetical protein HY250_02880 [Candidatus Azambacteria bacterium]|nr:hypothetical protein [Candidatus Azambacteria bacterium]